MLIPSLRWDPQHDFAYLSERIDDALSIGVGGFLIRGGPRDAVADLTTDLRARTSTPLLIAADAERGAGQQFDGATHFPPFAALTSLDDPDALRRAARITARDLRQLGLNWALAPVCDLDLEPGSAIVGTRSAGGDAKLVAAAVSEWVDACQAEGVLACAKHFPGHGHAADDSHLGLPTVRAGPKELWTHDLLPFRAACDAGVASVMAAHVAFPSLDGSGAPASLSALILTNLLRGEMQFDGLIASDSLEMDGVLRAGTESDVAARAIAAGCDVLVAPADIEAVASALQRAADNDPRFAARAADAVARRLRWAHWASAPHASSNTLDDMMWSRQLADRSVHLLRGLLPTVGAAVEVVIVDDDAAAARTAQPSPSRDFLQRTLFALDVDAPVVSEPSADTRVPLLVAAYADIVPWKGTAGFSAESLEKIERAVSAAHALRRHSMVILFSHPRNAAAMSAPNVLCAWGGEQPMQEAAARAVVRLPRAT